MSDRERTRASESKSKGEHFECRMAKIGIYTNFNEKEEGEKKREERKGGQERLELDILLAIMIRISREKGKSSKNPAALSCD